jgi:uncharacterized protein (DUF488 family)
VTLVADIRSYPYSAHAEWFNRDRIENSLRKAGVEYVFMGSRLGGLTEDGKFDYIKREKDASYQEGVKRLLEYAQQFNLVLLSSEGDFLRSHRHHLVAQTLLKLSVEVVHITESGQDAPAQADLFHSVAEGE